MIQATDLRIGNWLKRLDDTYFQVNPADFLYIEELNTRLRPLPIPLTEEILLKCGAVKNKFGDIILNGLMLAYITSDDNFQFEYTNPIMEWKIIDLKYLHTLQNLYWCLCGKELEVNL